MLRALPLSLLLILVAAATAQAATVKVPVPAEAQVAVSVASVAKKTPVKVKAPAGVAVVGAATKGRLAVAVIGRRGVAATGAVKVKVKGKAKRVQSFSSALAGGAAPAAACKTLAALLSKPLAAAGIAKADLRAVGAATAARLCGKPLPAGAQAILDRLGLGATPATSGGLTTPGTGRPKPPAGGGGGGGGGATNQCSNGIDDDGDGQIDAPSERELRPDPGCMTANDTTENSEVAVPAGCNAGAGVGDDKTVLQIGINDGCGEFVEVAVYAAPNAFVCDIAASAGNWVCVIAHGHAFAETRTAAADMADLQIGLLGPANCAVPATIVLSRPNLEVAELVTPIARCGEAAPACSNGADDDGDGMADARDTVPTHPADPDPGCSGPADASEDSEVALPAGCTVAGGDVGEDPQFPAVELSGCGSVTGVWFKPSASPADCVYAIGDGGGQACTVTGATVGVAFAATTAGVAIGGHTTTLPQCGPVTVAITLADGRVAALRDDWC